VLIVDNKEEKKMEHNSQPKKDNQIDGKPMSISLATIFEQQQQEDMQKFHKEWEPFPDSEVLSAVGTISVFSTSGELDNEVFQTMFKDSSHKTFPYQEKHYSPFFINPLSPEEGLRKNYEHNQQMFNQFKTPMT